MPTDGADGTENTGSAASTAAAPAGASGSTGSQFNAFTQNRAGGTSTDQEVFRQAPVAAVFERGIHEKNDARNRPMSGEDTASPVATQFDNTPKASSRPSTSTGTCSQADGRSIADGERTALAHTGFRTDAMAVTATSDCAASRSEITSMQIVESVPASSSIPVKVADKGADDPPSLPLIENCADNTNVEAEPRQYEHNTNGTPSTSDPQAAGSPSSSATSKLQSQGPAWDDYSPDECFICFDGGEILLCDYCDRSYHLSCHKPPLKEVPLGEFKCMECVAVSHWDDGSGTSSRKKKRIRPPTPNKARKYIKTRVAKVFHDVVYFGTVTDYTEKTGYWRIEYDDGDVEDYDGNDLEQGGDLYRKEKRNDTSEKKRGSQQRYYTQKEAAAPKKRAAAEATADTAISSKPNAVAKRKRAVSGARAGTSRPSASSVTPCYCVVQIPMGARPGDIFDVALPGNFISQVVCPASVQYSPFLSVVAPGGYQPPSETMSYARANADRLCAGLPTGYARSCIVEAFTETLWPALERDGWKLIRAEESGTGSTLFVPPSCLITSFSDSAAQLGLGYCNSYKGVMSFVAESKEYKNLHTVFEADCAARKESVKKAEQLKRDVHYLSSKPHDTPVGPGHQATVPPSPICRTQYQCSEMRKSCDSFWSPRFAPASAHGILGTCMVSQDNQDLEAAMQILCSYDYNEIACKAVLNMSVPSSDLWERVDEAQFTAAIKKHNQDLRLVAESLGMSLISTLWYFYHRYRPCRQWDSEDDQIAFHNAMIELNGNIKKVSDKIGKRFDSCLWFYYCKYRHLDLHKAYKQAEDESRHHDEWCAICDDGGELMCCRACPKAYHLACLSLEALPEGDWTCPICKEEGDLNGTAAGTPSLTCPGCMRKFRKPSGLSTHLKFCRVTSRSSDERGGNVAHIPAPTSMADGGVAPAVKSAAPRVQGQKAVTSEAPMITDGPADGGEDVDSNRHPSANRKTCVENEIRRDTASGPVVHDGGPFFSNAADSSEFKEELLMNDPSYGIGGMLHSSMPHLEATTNVSGTEEIGTTEPLVEIERSQKISAPSFPYSVKAPATNKPLEAEAGASDIEDSPEQDGSVVEPHTSGEASVESGLI